MEHKQDDKLKASEALLIISRVWLFLSLGALFLYFVVLAIEQSKATVYIWGVKPTRSYRVPIERDEAKEWEEAEETKKYHNIKGETDGDG